MFFRRFLNPIFYSFLFATLFFSCSDISERKASLVVNMPSSARAASLKERVAGYYVYLFRTDIPEAEQKEEQSESEENTKVAKPGESVFFDDLEEGEYLVCVEAFDKDEGIIGGGEAKAKVVAGETANVSITLKGVEDDGEKSDEEENSVVAVTKVTLNKTDIELAVDETETLVATVAPDNATDKSVTWKSSNPSVAKVENGVVTALEGGTATITATAGEVSATCNVTVPIVTETLKWDYNIVEAFENVATKDGITINSTGTKSAGNFYSGTLTFSIDGGRRFTKIEMLSTATNISGTGVTVEEVSFYSTQDTEEVIGSKITWIGDASEVSMSGYAYAVEYIQFTIR